MYKDLKEKFEFTLGATHVGISHNIGGALHKLVESFTHVGISHNTRRVGFTLSEVLITLGVIGIVSAMTIPTLVKKYQQMLLVTRFKKEYSTLSQAYKLALLDFGPTPPRCGYYETSSTLNNGEASWGDCQEYGRLVLKRLHVVKECKGNALRDGCNPGYKGIDDVTRDRMPSLTEDEIAQKVGNSYWKTQYLNDNAHIFLLKDGSSLISYGTVFQPRIFLLDINGLEGPNKWGYDLFDFRLYFKADNPYNPIIEGTTSTLPEYGGVQSKTMFNKIQNNMKE